MIPNPDGEGFVMVYERVSGGEKGRHRLGLAASIDGKIWSQVADLTNEPGGPIFEGADAESDAWDNGNVGTP